MAVPTQFSELSTTASSNPPADTEGVSEGDNQFRQVYAFIRSLYEGSTNGQIAFPAVQNASAGANTLDDYEEGTWTPGISFGGGTTGITYTTQVGRYVKFGKVVYVSARIGLSSKGSSTGALLITGLPFTAVDSEARGTGSIGYYIDFTGITGTPFVMAVKNTTTAEVRIPGATASTGLSSTYFTDASDFYFSMVYEATA